MKIGRFILLFALMAALLAACAAATQGTQPTSSTPSGEVPEAAIKARQFLANVLNLSADEITIVSYEAVDWPNTCFGVSLEQMCAEVITPGYRVTLEAKTQRYEVRTDAEGKSIRQVP